MKHNSYYIDSIHSIYIAESCSPTCFHTFELLILASVTILRLRENSYGP